MLGFTCIFAAVLGSKKPLMVPQSILKPGPALTMNNRANVCIAINHYVIISNVLQRHEEPSEAIQFPNEDAQIPRGNCRCQLSVEQQ